MLYMQCGHLSCCYFGEHACHVIDVMEAPLNAVSVEKTAAILFFACRHLLWCWCGVDVWKSVWWNQLSFFLILWTPNMVLIQYGHLSWSKCSADSYNTLIFVWNPDILFMQCRRLSRCSCNLNTCNAVCFTWTPITNILIGVDAS